MRNVLVLHLPEKNNYHTGQSEVEYRLVFRNSLYIACIEQFHKELVNWDIR